MVNKLSAQGRKELPRETKPLSKPARVDHVALAKAKAAVRGELKAGTEAKKAAQRPSKAVVARPAEVEQQLGELAKHDPKPVKPKSAEPIPKGLREVEVKFKNGAVARYLERQPTLKGPLNPEQLGAIA